MIPSEAFYTRNSLAVLLSKIDKRKRYIRRNVRSICVTADYLIMIDKPIREMYAEADIMAKRLSNHGK